MSEETTTDENEKAMIKALDFIFRVARTEIGIPIKVRREATALLRHYPTREQIAYFMKKVREPIKP